ncbi:fatty acyl-CoA reductase 1 [Parasteatoda tepidariorum]|nr:fatty acyl-CoA reductase 1 [Parasteatoda tepidariorum]XP_015930045.1 fatty acyl-CoA reductase 1 [Parasteatoda tepidariorum]XP_015930046.1 fatty acyl-CoA reductase 1 [Parasteatoda tepidariorum]XP_015930047.1 fatty acyl-CoA reductase 1 [Parasteatoda tepidariorum]
MDSDAFLDLTEIQKFFFGRSIFITGGTGLVGKVLVEKLLRCCPGITMLYLLVRPKRNLSPEARGEKLFKTELFKKLKEVFPNFPKKVTYIEGDLQKERLGISDADFKLLQDNVSIVFHSAARVQFNDPLRLAVQHNVIATKAFVDMCHELPHVISVVHVSTSYVRREDDGYVLERVPKMKVTPKQILDALEWMDPGSEQAVCDYLLEGKLTTYLVTKALGEIVVEENRGDLPTAIVRPCNISPTWKDPFPGWVDSVQGVSGLMLAGAKGVLRTLRSVRGLKINLIPVDIVVNSMIASAWHVGTKKPDNVFVVNCVIDYDKLPEGDTAILQVVLKKRDEYPLANVFRYPDFTIHYNPIAYHFHALWDQWIPAIIVDSLLFIFTGKTVLIKVYKKINFLYGIFHRLGRTPWICKLENFTALRKSLQDKDQEIFFLNADDIDWIQYMDDCLYGGRKFLAHEPDSNIPYARKKAKVWWFVTTVMKWCLLFYIFYYFFYEYVSNIFFKDDSQLSINS